MSQAGAAPHRSECGAHVTRANQAPTDAQHHELGLMIPNGDSTDCPCSTTFELMEPSTALSTQEMILLGGFGIDLNLVRYSRPL